LLGKFSGLDLHFFSAHYDGIIAYYTLTTHTASSPINAKRPAQVLASQSSCGCNLADAPTPAPPGVVLKNSGSNKTYQDTTSRLHQPYIDMPTVHGHPFPDFA
jgi:hypothetical protein